MKRRQVFEIEDQDWCPPSLRDGLTDYLRFALDMVRPYNTIAPRLAEAVRKSGATRIVDLCSGGGGPWRTLLPALHEAGCTVPVRLTDRFPNVSAFEAVRQDSGGAIEYSAEPVDATAVGSSTDAFRTIFTAFHHFSPELARQVLRDAVRGGRGIAIFEFLERKPHQLIGSTLIAPLLVWLTVPLMRPFRWRRLLWTYPLPVLPLTAAVDGTMSIFRSYTPAELLELTRDMPEFEWQAGVQDVPRAPTGVTWLIGVPRR